MHQIEIAYVSKNDAESNIHKIKGLRKNANIHQNICYDNIKIKGRDPITSYLGLQLPLTQWYSFPVLYSNSIAMVTTRLTIRSGYWWYCNLLFQRTLYPQRERRVGLVKPFILLWGISGNAVSQNLCLLLLQLQVKNISGDSFPVFFSGLISGDYFSAFFRDQGFFRFLVSGKMMDLALLKLPHRLAAQSRIIMGTG